MDYFKFYPKYLLITKFTNQALILSYLQNLFEMNDHKPFVKSNEDIKQDLNINTPPIMYIKKGLKQLGFINYKRFGNPGKILYTVNLDKINEALERVK